MEDLLTQHKHILSLLPRPETLLSSFDTVYLLSKPWWVRWEAYVSSTGRHPGPIDNLPLFAVYKKEDGAKTAKLRLGLILDRDYIYLSPVVWSKLQLEYTGGPEAELFVFEGALDWSPVALAIQTQSFTQYFSISLKMSVAKLKKIVCTRLQLPESKYDLKRGTQTLEASLMASLYSLGVRDQDVLTLSERRVSFIDLEMVNEDIADVNFEAYLDATVQASEDRARRMDVTRDDKEAVLVRIEEVRTQAKADMKISGIAKSKKRLDQLYEDWERSSVT